MRIVNTIISKIVNIYYNFGQVYFFNLQIAYFHYGKRNINLIKSIVETEIKYYNKNKNKNQKVLPVNFNFSSRMKSWLKKLAEVVKWQLLEID